MATLRSVNVGLPRDIPWRGATVHTAIWKQPVERRVMARKLNLDGDGQGDLAGHGGEQRAVMVYQLDSYRYWESQLGRRDFTFGEFGENFTVDGLPDDEVCIGDRYRIGSTLFEVTQPRVTCYRVGIRVDEPRMASLLVAHHRPGFYLRVIEEGEVGAGDEITKVADGAERMNVAEIDALLYLPGHPRDRLERALRIPALSAGWKDSFEGLIAQGDASDKPGSTAASIAPAAAWIGFRPMRVARIDRESADVTSISFEAVDGARLVAALPGQFLVLQVRPSPELPPVLRNYSISSAPGADAYRISVKREAHGVVSAFLNDRVRAGDILEVSAPRGAFTLQQGDGPVVLLSSGIGATPVLAMLHQLVSAASARQVWWLYGARNRDHHPFGRESRALLEKLAGERTYVAYSAPGPEDRLGQDYDSQGHLSVPLLDRLGVPRDADFYLCGPAAFLSSFAADLKTWGVAAGRIHQEVFGPEASITPGIASSVARAVHAPSGAPGSGPSVSFTRSGLTVPWSAKFQSLLEFAEACDVSVRWSCRTGVCHTCECALIGGSVEYAPDPLEPPAPGNVLVCCAQPSADVEIDL
jgi:ferredoxin-NADP reductase/MOSC domain-containing protein YiiM